MEDQSRSVGNWNCSNETSKDNKGTEVEEEGLASSASSSWMFRHSVAISSFSLSSIFFKLTLETCELSTSVADLFSELYSFIVKTLYSSRGNVQITSATGRTTRNTLIRGIIHLARRPGRQTILAGTHSGDKRTSFGHKLFSSNFGADAGCVCRLICDPMVSFEAHGAEFFASPESERESERDGYDNIKKIIDINSTD